MLAATGDGTEDCYLMIHQEKEHKREKHQFLGLWLTTFHEVENQQSSFTCAFY